MAEAACFLLEVGNLMEQLQRVALVPMKKLYLVAKLMMVHPTEPKIHKRNHSSV